jgi:hypothetical protein
MSKRWRLVLILLLGVAAILRTAGDFGFWRRYLAVPAGDVAGMSAALIQPRIRIAGVGDVAVPRSTLVEEGIDEAAVAAAIAQAKARGARAFLVHRHGHRVVEFFAANMARPEITGGELAPALLAFATGALVADGKLEQSEGLAALTAAIAATRATSTTSLPKVSEWRNPWSVEAREELSPVPPPPYMAQRTQDITGFISSRVWQPLRAADAYLWGNGVEGPRLDCCVVARVDDWMRVGDVILQDGVLAGERVVASQWMQKLFVVDPMGHAHALWTAPLKTTGDEPPATREALGFDLGPDARLWLLPQRQMAIFYWAAAGSGDATNTEIPNMVIRAIVEQSPARAAELRDLVPAH